MEHDPDFSGVPAASAVAATTGVPGQHPWREALCWMLALGLLFIVGYRATNQWAAERAATLSLHGTWDDAIPFLPWTILPYLSLNLIFPCTFFAYEHLRPLRRHAARIAVVQLASFAVFALMPTANVRQLPQPDGIAGMLFEPLRAFERPYNMFPSLHAAVLLLVWRAWLPALQGRTGACLAWHGWCLLILVSTVTTWQHDLLDVAGGLALGMAALRILPADGRAEGSTAS